MGEALITRKTAPSGTKEPTISLISKDIKTITITITNNDVDECQIYYDLNDSTPDTFVNLAAGATSSNIVYSELTSNELYTISAFALTDGKKPSNLITLNVSTDAIAVPSINVTSIESSVINFTITNNEDYEGDVYYELDVAEPDTTFVTLAATTTSSGLSFDGLTPDTSSTIYARTFINGVYSSVATNVQTLPLPSTPSISSSNVLGATATLTLTNNDTVTATVYYDTVTPPTANSVTLNSGQSTNINLSGLDQGTEFTYYAATEINGVLSNSASTTFTTLVLNYTNATGGTTLEYNSGGKRYRSHTFTGSGTFTVTEVGDNIDDRNKIDYLMIAGGGGGSNQPGGGAGGYFTSFGTSGASTAARPKVTVSQTSYSITVGGGGSAGANGGNTSAFGFTVNGGGRGGASGGSGGGNSAAGTANQGRNGGNAGSEASAGIGGPYGPIWGGSMAGGGGGAGGAGGNGFFFTRPAGQGYTKGQAGSGGGGINNSLRTGSNEARGGGGGAQGRVVFNNFIGGQEAFLAGNGSSGGGNGACGTPNQTSTSGVRSATPGTANTGGGGGGGFGYNEFFHKNGGSGIVVIRYEIALA